MNVGAAVPDRDSRRRGWPSVSAVPFVSEMSAIWVTRAVLGVDSRSVPVLMRLSEPVIAMTAPPAMARQKPTTSRTTPNTLSTTRLVMCTPWGRSGSGTLDRQAAEGHLFAEDAFRQ